MRFFKVKLKQKQSLLESYLHIMAESPGEAVVIADDRCERTPFEVCNNPVTEISEKDYQDYIEHLE